MLVPIPRGLTESLQPRRIPLSADSELHARYREWEQSRSGFLDGLRHLKPEAIKQSWQKDYFQGRTAEGKRFESHQTRLAVQEFSPEPRAQSPPGNKVRRYRSRSQAIRSFTA